MLRKRANGERLSMTSIPDLLAGLRIVDLTHDVEAGIPLLPFQQPIAYEDLVTYEQGAMVRQFTLDEHQGTHADAPVHFVPGGSTIDQVPVETLVTHAYLADLRSRVAADPDHRIAVDDVLAFEESAGARIDGGIFVAFTGWSAKWRDPAAYYGHDAEGHTHFPGFSMEAADFLRRSRGVAGIAIDGPSVDGGTAATFPVHHGALAAGMIFVENLCRLEEIGEPRFGIVIAPLKLAGGSGAPARVFALASRHRGP